MCVHFGNSTRIVNFESTSAYDDLSEVSKAIRTTFKLDQNAELIVQAQNDPDWAEKWLDVLDGDEIPDKSELKVVVQVRQLACSYYIEAKYNNYICNIFCCTSSINNNINLGIIIMCCHCLHRLPHNLQLPQPVHAIERQLRQLPNVRLEALQLSSGCLFLRKGCN